MGHTADADKLLKIPGNKLRSIVRDDPGFGPRVLLLGSLQNQLHFRLGHRLSYYPSYIPVDHIAAIAIEETA